MYCYMWMNSEHTNQSVLSGSLTIRSGSVLFAYTTLYLWEVILIGLRVWAGLSVRYGQKVAFYGTDLFFAGKWFF